MFVLLVDLNIYYYLKMLDATKISKEDIEAAVLEDISVKDDTQIDKLKQFYYNILVEPEIRTSSFRYFHAKCSLETICRKFDDNATITNLSMFHRQKVQFEIDHPVEKEPVVVKKNPATREDRFGRVSDKSAGQVTF